MPLKITGELTSTIVEHTGAAIPASTPVPSKREAIEALGLIASLTHRNVAGIVDNELVTVQEALETLRRFIATR